MEHESYGDTICNWCVRHSHLKGTGGLGNQRTSKYHPDYAVIKIGQNTEKSPRDLRKFAVTQTPV